VKPIFAGGNSGLRRTAKTKSTKKQNTKMKSIITSTAALLLLSVAAFAGDLVNISGASKAAVNGYDTVAFFTDAKPVNGSPFISAEHKGATYFFANEDHKKLFTVRGT